MIDLQIGDSRKLIHGLTDTSIDCVMTSPPYWGLRDYGTEPIIFDGAVECNHIWGEDIVKKQSGGTNNKIGNNCDDRIHYESKTNFCSLCGAWLGQLGLEPTPELYLSHLLDFFDDVKLKLKDEGNCFVNLGDTYWGGGNASGHTEDTKQFGTSKTLGKSYVTKPVAIGKHPVLRAKSLVMIPERFAWGMIERGWILRNSIIWHKRNHMPESVTDRWTKAHEVIYFFTKQQKNYFNLDAIREKNKPETIGRYQRAVQLGANAVQGKFLQREEQNTGVPRRAPKWFIEGANTGDNNKEPYKANNPHTMRLKNDNYSGKFDGATDSESFGSPRARTQRKHQIGDGYRQGMNRDETDISIQRVHGVNQKEIAEFLKEHILDTTSSNFLPEHELDAIFGEHRWRHWIRTDDSGACLPSPEQWESLKRMAPWLPNTFDELMLTIKGVPQIVAANANGKNPGTVWDVTTQPYSEAHFATFPIDLVRQPILAGCPVGGTVLDPFGGSGTVGEFCRNNERNAILFELNPEYSKLINERAMITTPELSSWCSTKTDA